MPLLVQYWASGKSGQFLFLSLGLLASVVTCADVTLNLEFGLIRAEDSSLAAPDSMWALMVAPPGSPLPGGMEENSSLTLTDIPAARADFGGASIQPGTNLGTAVIIATGQLGPENDVIVEIKWTNKDYNNIETGGLIGLYWFPGINGSTATLPENNFEIGGLQETTPNTVSGGNAGMVVPTNSGQNLTIPYYDETIVSGGLPPPPTSPPSMPPQRLSSLA